jgi:MFS superfamily sulfate permease-like transporter
VYALLGTSRTLSVGPAAVAAIILKTAVEHLPANKNQHKLDKKN